MMQKRLCSSCKSFWIILVMLLALVGFAVPAHAAENPYTGVGYDAAQYGPVDLMRYMQRVTVTIDGVDYTQEQLIQLRDAGTPITQRLGDTISVNFLFALSGRSYAADDPTRLDEASSVKVVYTNGHQALNGDTVAPGTEGILDDTALMRDNTSPGNSFLRMDISWIYDLCPGDYTISYTDGNVSFQQGTGENSRYLYVYFPKGVGSDLYAEPGYFTINLTQTKEVKEFHVPGHGGFYVPGQDGWTFPVVVTSQQISNKGDIHTYGDITVVKRWETTEPHPDAVIVLEYTENGQRKSARRTISGDTGSAVFTIRRSMSECKLSEDMTGLDDYKSELTNDGKTYTFVNRLNRNTELTISKKEVTGMEELAGAKLVLYQVGADGARTEIDSWTSETEPHKITVDPGSYLLRETKAPAGYAMSTNITFTVGTDGTVTMTGASGSLNGHHIDVLDEPLKVHLSKEDEAGNPVVGAQLRLTDETTGEIVDEWTSTNEKHTILYASERGVVLVAGHTYRFEELSAPSGYEMAEPITFVFNGDGTIPNCGYRIVRMIDKVSPNTTPTPDPNDSPDVTPAPTTPGSGPIATPNPNDGPSATDSTFDANGSGSNHGDGDKNGGNSSKDDALIRMTGVATGDSPMMWVWLVLGFVFLAAACTTAGFYFHRR